MKKILFLIASLFLFMVSFGQTKINPAYQKDYYLSKSKSQKTIAWIMLGGGIALATTGILVAGKNTDDLLGDLGNKGLGTILEITGAVGTLGSIFFFTSAAKNKRLAATMSFDTKRNLLIQQNTFVYRIQPAITLKVTF